MRIAGVDVTSADIVWLADQLIANGRNDTAAKLLRADGRHQPAAGRLTAADRAALLEVLEQPPKQLTELRTALTT